MSLLGPSPRYYAGATDLLSKKSRNGCEPLAGHDMEWKIEWNGSFGVEDARMEWKISRMEWKTIFYINSILDFAHGIYRKIYTDSR